MIKSIVFDFDGVILDSNSIKEHAFRKLYENSTSINLKKILDYHKKNLGISRFKKIEYFTTNILLESFDQNILKLQSDKFENIVKKKILDCDFIQGVLNFIELINPNYDLFISSGSPEKELKEICRIKEIDRYFNKIYGSPDDKYFHLKSIIDLNSYSNNEILFIGDSIIDYEVSKKFDISFLGIGNEIKKYTKDTFFTIDNFLKIESIKKNFNLIF